MYGQLGLEVPLKNYNDFQIASNFHEFWSEELYYKKKPPKKTLMFKHYNLMNPME
jgi:hypothetical protein